MADKKISIDVELKSNLEKSKETMASLKEKGGFAKNPKAEKVISGYIQELEKLSEVAQPTTQQLSKIRSLFNAMSEALLKVAYSTKEASKEFKEIESTLAKQNEAKNKLTKERSGILKQGRVNKETQQYELFETYQDSVVRQANIKNKKGQTIKSASTFLNKFDEEGNPVAGAFLDPKAAKDLYNSLKTTQETNATRLAELNNKIEEYKKAIEDTTNKLNEQAQKEGSSLAGDIIKRKVDFNESIDDNKEQLRKNKEGDESTRSVQGYAKAVNEQSSALGRAFKQFTIYNVAVKAVKKALSEAVKTIKELDKYLTEQAMVTGMSREQTYGLVKSYQDLALQCGATTKEIAQVSTEYMKQGKTIQESLVLTEAAVKAAKVARVSVGDSVNYLTTALNGFRLSANDAMKVSDKFAAVAAASATDYDELAIALSKVASQANLAGMSIDYTTALLTKGLETTREAPETMGTALKTIIARMRELGDYGETLEGDTDLNNVESQLSYVGIALRDASGELRSTEEVLDQLGQKWDTLNKNQQAALAKALAGTRQQSRLIAMMDGYERVIELQQIAERSAGTTAAQADVYLEGMEGAINRVTVAWEKVVMTFSDSELIINTINLASNFLDKLATQLENPFWMGAAVTAVVLSIEKGLGLKIQEQEIARETARIELQQMIIKSKDREQELQEKIQSLEKTKNISKAELKAGVQKLKLAKKETAEKQKQANAKLVADGKMTKEAQAAADAEIDKKLQEELKDQAALEKEIQEEWETNYNKKHNLLTDQLRLQHDVTKSLEGQTSSIINQQNAWGGYLTFFKNIGRAFVGITTNIVTGFRAAAEASKKAKEANMPASASWIPYVGWAIALVLEGINLFSIIATAVGPVIKMVVNWIGSMGNSAEATTGRINELSDNIYKLTKQADEIGQIIDKFDSLDNKLIKTNKDLEEMSSLLEQAGEKLIDEEVDDKTDIGFGLGVSAKEYYEQFSTERGKRAALNKIIQVSRDQANIDRGNIIQDFMNMSDADKTEVLNSTDNAKYLKTQDAMFAINNNNLYTYIDKLKESGDLNDDVATHVEKFTQNILDNISATEAWEYASDTTASGIKNMVDNLKDVTLWAENAQGEMETANITKILTTDDYRLVDRVKAYKEAYNTISALGDEIALAAFETNFIQYERFTQYSERTLEFIDSVGLSIDELNSLYSSWEKLQKKGVNISQEVFELRFDSYVNMLAQTQGDVLAATEIIFGDYLDGSEEALNAFIEAYGDLVQVGVLNMGQNMDKINNTINSFYEKATKWSTMTNSEKAEFIQDNAEMFADNPDTAENEGQALLKAFESGNYEEIEGALKGNTALQKQIEKRKAEIQQELLIEEARKGADRNEAYIAQLKDYEKYLNDVNNMFKASLELRLEQEKNQLEEYKKLVQEEEQAKIDSINKRKEAYEKYFDDIDEREEKEEYEDKAELLVSNLSKLSASDTSEAQKQTKDLENQLKELEKERQKELREQARESVLEDMDDQVEQINDNLEKLLESNRALLAAMEGRLDDNPQKYIADLIGDKVQSGATANEIEEYFGTLQSVYGSAFKDGDLEDIQIREENNQLILNVNGQEIILDPTNETNLFEAIMTALRQIGLR